MSSSADESRLSKIILFAQQSPIKFVALVTLLVTGAVPVGAFLLYAAGTVACTIIAAVVLDLSLLVFGVFCLALALCFAGCITGGVAGLFAVVYVAYRAAVESFKGAKARLTPSTVTSSDTSSEDDATFDKNKHLPVKSDFPTSLTTFLTTLFSLTSVSYESSNTNTDTEVGGNSEQDGDTLLHSDICKTSLIVFGLTSAILVMSYTVLITAYMVVNFT